MPDPVLIFETLAQIVRARAPSNGRVQANFRGFRILLLQEMIPREIIQLTCPGSFIPRGLLDVHVADGEKVMGGPR